MFRFLLRICIATTTALLGLQIGHAAYIPAPQIYMTGSNSEVRFDVASHLYGSYTATGPTLSTSDKKFSGVFYAQDIGWIWFATGSYQTMLNCGAQDLSSLSTICNLTGSGWNENIGEIGFAGVQYNPSTGRLVGKAYTFLGDVSLTGIALPLRPITLPSTPIIASKSMSFPIDDPSIYSGGPNAWNITYAPASSPTDALSYASLVGLDLSLATLYQATVVDPSGSQTKGLILDVRSAAPALVLDAGSYHAKTVCASSSNPALCPDGSERSPTVYLQEPPVGSTSVVANGSDEYKLTLKLRDTYGNRIEGGSINIHFDTTVKKVQASISENASFIPSMDGDATILDGGLYPFFPNPKPYTVGGADIISHVQSIAPTNTTTDMIRMSSVTYTDAFGVVTSVTPSVVAPLGFRSIYDADMGSSTPIIIGSPYVFDIQMTTRGSVLPPDPDVMMNLIPEISGDVWDPVSTSPIAQCTHTPLSPNTVLNPICGWTMSGSWAVAQSSLDFSLTGTYKALGSDPPGKTNLRTYIHYKYTDGSDILYPSQVSQTATAEEPKLRFKVVGSASRDYSTPASVRVDVTNSLRAQAVALSRNRTNYDDADYLIIQGGDHTISDFSAFGGTMTSRPKRAIIVMGGTLKVNVDIPERDHPIALIALADQAGNGGDIQIAGSVRDIHASLIAEHSITSEVSDRQLTIQGTFVSSNTLSDPAPTTCPYYVTSSCTPALYDLPGQRIAYMTLPDADRAVKKSAHPLSAEYTRVPVILVADSRTLSDPPPMLRK